MEKVAGLQFEDKVAVTECRVTKTGRNQDRDEAAENIRTDEMITYLVSRTRERLGQKRGRRYALGQRLWQPAHIRGTLRAL